MKLTAAETDYVNGQLNTYDIKYQEIYDELKDHILTAIENLRNEGDTRAIDVVFNGVIKTQFPGYWPFEDIVSQYLAAYRKKIQHTMWAGYKHYFNSKTIPLMVLLLAFSFYLPHSKTTMVVMMVLLLIVSVVPVAYVYRKGLAIKTDKGKYSLVKTYVTHSSNYSMVLFNLLFNLVGAAAKNWKSVSFLNPLHYAPAIYILLLVFAFTYCLNCIHLAKQEFKIA